jgi:hypothetical protein
MGKNESDKNKPLADMHDDGMHFNENMREKKKRKEREDKKLDQEINKGSGNKSD